MKAIFTPAMQVRAGAGHYRVRIASAAFIGRSLLARHRLVYDALADWMPHRIHALAIEIDRSQG